MGAISKMIDDLNKIYAVVSIGGMKDLCTKAGVAYRDSDEASLLVRDLYEKGHKIVIEKHSIPDVAVGQTLVLRNLDGTFVHGHQIWIDFKDDYVVKDKELFSEDDIITFKGNRS